MNWKKKEIPPEQIRNIAERYDCDLLTASILARRDITQGEEILYYLENDPRHLRNPYELSGMEDAVERLLAAREEGEKILVFGDRDVDGITSTTLLVQLFRNQGMDVSWQVPVGDDAYGLSIEAVENFARDYGTLIVTVDCGISNIAEIDRAAELGIDVIVVDHHNPQEELPRAHAIINPKLVNEPYPFRDLAGCGVAYKLASAFRFALKSELYNQPVCLLNTRPTNDAYVIEAVHIRNLCEQERLTETVVPGMVQIDQTRLLPFLQGQQICVWDADLQKKTIAKIFGNGVEVHMLDIAAEISREIPTVAGKSLLRIKELSRIARYSDKTRGELDVFVNLFVSFARKKEAIFSDEDIQDLQLAALGTVADLMPLKNENRILVKNGLAALGDRARPGISDLLYKLGLSGKRISTSDVSWQLCPAINASGRMGRPDIAVKLLLESDPAERDRLADSVIQMNEDRKKLGNEVWPKIESMATDNMDTYGGKLAFAFGEEIHRGISGIMANKMVGLFKIPALAVSFGKNNTITGSLRSTRGYDLRGLLEQCADLFIDWGGHDYAAGFSMEKDKWNDFLDRLKRASVSIELQEDEDAETVHIDAELPVSYLNPELLQLVDRFEPYGEENKPLIFMAKKLRINDMNIMGKSEVKHVKLNLNAGTYSWPAIYWKAADKIKKEFDLHDTVDLVFRVNRNWFNGNETPQLIISDLKRSS